MKYGAIAAIVLLLLPLIPLAVANQPNWNVELRIRPGATTYYGPCVVSTNFPIDVYLFNDKSLSLVGVYAYDFKVSWQNTAGISLVNFANHIPWPTGKYFLIINETYTVGALDYYHVALTAVGNSTIDPSLELGATGVFNASIVTLTFHLDEEPFWPDTFHADFTILDYVASTGCGGNIANWEIDNGTYDLISSKPEIDPEATEAPPFPDNITECVVDSTFSVYIHLKNIVGAYGFGFTLTFDPAWKQTDIQHITILPAFAPPYELLKESVDNSTGVITIELIRPCEKPTIHGVDFAVVKIDFVETATPEIGVVPYPYTTDIALTDAWVNIKNKTWTGTYHFIESNAIKAAADRLVALQGTTDPGWDWTVTSLTAHSATYPSPKNIWGVTAIGLSEAYMLTHNAAYLTAALNVANYWLTLGPTNFFIPAGGGFGYSWDYRFLMEMTEITGNSAYATFAQAAWAYQKTSHPTLRYADGNQMQLWDRYCNFWIGPNSYGAAAWGTGDWGLAALALGDTTWSNHMAAVIHANMTNILVTPVDTDYKDLGIGKALEFFATLGDPAYAADIEALIDQLKADQLADDSWGYGPLYPGDVQVTAYVVIGLCAAGEHAACQQGVNWLVANQMTTGVGAGGWDLGGYEISEVDSEALKAIVTCNGYSGDLPNIFKPKSNADLNLDGVVDIEDLAALAAVYGTSHPWSDLAAPGYTANVDIFDLVYAAKRYLDP